MGRVRALVCFLITWAGAASGQTLEEILRQSAVPVEKFAPAELGAKITSYALPQQDPFLLAYYTDDGSGVLRPPLHVIRYDRAARDLRRADISGAVSFDCLGSVLAVREHGDWIWIDLHITPSAGCLIVLSKGLAFKTALSGGLVGWMGPDDALVEGSEIHFMSVHPLHVSVFDVKRNRSVVAYPVQDDLLRRQYSGLIRPYISQQWCMKSNAQCDPDNFDAALGSKVAFNEKSRVFGFEVIWDAAGFGEAAEQHVHPRTVVYVYRERGEVWEHRSFDPKQMRRFGVPSLEELVREKPNAAFEEH